MIDDYAGGADPVIEIRELGGTVGDTTLHVVGAAQFLVGDDILALVEHTAGGWRPSSMSRSVYGVRDTVAGAELLRQESGEPVVGDAGPRRRSLASFAATIRSVRRRGPVRLSAPGDVPAAANLESATPIVASYKLLGNMRWHEADSGATVLWYRNTLTPSPLDSGNSDARDRPGAERLDQPGWRVHLARVRRDEVRWHPRRCSVAERRPSPVADSSRTRTRTTTSPPAA